MRILKNKIKKGFTLIELLIVISIIGFLASTAMYAINSARAKSRDTQRIADIKQIQKALELYYDDKKIYPQTSWVSSHLANWNTLANELKPYMERLSIDPMNQTNGLNPTSAMAAAYDDNFVYSYFGGTWGSVGKQFYMIVFNLEDKKNVLQIQDGALTCSDRPVTTPASAHYGNGSDGTITLGGCADALR